MAGGQALAELATCRTLNEVYRFSLLPVGFRIIVPALASEFINIFKNSALALTIGVLELTSRTRQIAEYTYQAIELFAAATLLYAAISLGVTYLMRRLEARALLPGMIAHGRG